MKWPNDHERRESWSFGGDHWEQGVEDCGGPCRTNGHEDIDQGSGLPSDAVISWASQAPKLLGPSAKNYLKSIRTRLTPHPNYQGSLPPHGRGARKMGEDSPDMWRPVHGATPDYPHAVRRARVKMARTSVAKPEAPFPTSPIKRLHDNHDKRGRFLPCPRDHGLPMAATNTPLDFYKYCTDWVTTLTTPPTPISRIGSESHTLFTHTLVFHDQSRGGSTPPYPPCNS